MQVADRATFFSEDRRASLALLSDLITIGTPIFAIGGSMVAAVWACPLAAVEQRPLAIILTFINATGK
jgi:hypothetical protein